MSRNRIGRGKWQPQARFRVREQPATQDSPADAQYVRFVGEHVDPDSHEREGIVQITVRLLDEKTLDPEAHEALSAALDEMLKGLPRPRRLSPFRDALPRGRAHRSRKTPIAISWFKDSATERIALARRVVALLARAGVPVEELRTSSPGYVTYEDELQIVAVPFTRSA